MRVVVDPPVGARDPDRIQQLEGAGLRLSFRHVLVQLDRLDELLPDTVDGIQ